MKLVTFKQGDELRLGALDGADIVDLTQAGVAGSMLELIGRGEPGLRLARDAVARGRRMPLDATKLAPPIPKPGKILCSGVNYKSHAEEHPTARMPSEPFFFAKLPNTIRGQDDPIIHPGAPRQVDYEVELAAVIGRRLYRAAEAEILPALFGYTLLHDVSARDVQLKDSQVTLGKNFDGFCPLGPCITTADALPHPGRVALKTRLNGNLMQDGSTADWLFPLPRLLSFLSQVMTLEPGDIVSTGTPAGVGLFRKPQVFMQPGDVVEIEAEGIGILRNRIVAA